MMPTMATRFLGLQTLLFSGLSFSVIAEPTAAGVTAHWTFEASGDDAPRRERFVVRPEVVEWLDDHGRVRWRLERNTSTLVQIDPQDGSERSMDKAARAAIADELARARAMGLDAVVRPGQRMRPWAAVESADRWVWLQERTQIAGVPCRRVSLSVNDSVVGEACIADAQTQPGGPALLQMLQSLLDLADEMGRHGGAALRGAWPLHPLVTAARAGGIPLQVLETLPGEHPREWRLAAPPSGTPAR